MRKPLSFSFVALIAFFVVMGIILLFSFMGSSQQTPNLPTLPDSNSQYVGNTLDYSRIDIHKNNVQDIISAMNRPDEYYVETKSEILYDNSTSVNLRRKWVRDGLSRIDVLTSGGTVTMSSIYTGSTVYYWTPASGRVLEIPRGNFTANDEQMLMDYTTLLALPAENIIDAKLSRISGEQCIYVEAKNSLGYIEKYWISTRNGLLLSGQAFDGDTLVYSVSIIELVLTRPDDIEFTLPDKRLINS